MNNTYKTNKTDWRRLVRSVLFVALLLGGNVTAQTYYVFHNSTQGYIYNNGVNGGVQTTFTKSAIWAANGALGTTSRTIYSYTDNAKYMRGGNGSFTLDNNSQNNWQLRNSVLAYYNSYRSYHVYWNNGALSCAQNQQGNGFTPTSITLNNVAVSNPTLSITAGSGISGGIQLSPAVTGFYAPACTSADVRNTTYYWTASTEASTSRPGVVDDWSDATLTWTVTTGGTYASVSSDGLVTITANPTGNIVVRLGVSKGGYTNANAATITLTREAVAQGTVTSTAITTFEVSPATAELNNNTNRTFAATAQATTSTTTVPAHTTLTGGGKEFYFYNNTLYASTDDFSSDPVVTGPTSDGISYAWTLNGLPTGVTYSGQNSANLTIAAGTMPDPTIATATVTVTASKGGASSTKSFTVDFYNGVTVVDEMSDLGASGYYVLAADIDASSFTGDITFTGTLDGRYHTISGLTRPLFTTVNGGTVKNVIIDKVTISGIANAGAICGTAQGNAKIYNCGVLNSDGTSSVSGTTNAGGLVGTIASSSNVRVVNCYNYATVGGGTYAAGIVGRNQGTVSGTTTVNATGVRITNCMMYGNMTAGTNRSPVYGGNHTNNVQQLHEYNYYRSRANLTYTAYNDQLAIDKDEYLTRFPFYRHIQNTHRELAAYFLFGAEPSAAQVDEIGHWVLKPEVAPYPIIEPWIEDTRRTTVDIAAHLPATTEKYAGKLLNNIGDDGYYTGAGEPVTSMGNNGYLTVNVTINGSNYTSSLPITDMDTLNYDFTWGKVVLPFANEYSGWTEPTTATTDYGKICTGWKITSVTKDGEAKTTFSIPAGEPYNFADRDNPQKDIYHATNNPYIFAQGGNYIVPYGVTAINIEANFANAFYLSDANYDFAYDNGYNTQTALTTTVPTTYNGKTVYTNLSTLIGKMSNATNPHQQAIVLVGNFHYNQRVLGTLFSTAKGLTIMSIDKDNNQEPDYGWYSFHTTDRTDVPAIRFDFVPNVGIGMAARVTNSNPYPTIGIWHAKSWFELTETCVSIMNECEITKGFTNSDNGSGNNRWIANSGYFLQIVYTRGVNDPSISYVQIGGNAYVEQFYPGPHVNQNNSINLVPVNVTGGEIEECFMTGKGANSSAKAKGANIYFWCAGGRIHKYLSAFMVDPNTDGVNVTAKVDHAVIRRFFGGGTSPNARITGYITITMNNSLVDFYCGGPEFGNMTAGKTVTTHATGTTFGKYYGAGFGGTAITWVTKQDATVVIEGNATYPYNQGFNNYTDDRLRYVSGNGGYGTCYSLEYIFYAGGGKNNEAKGQAVQRFYTGYANFDLATTGSVTNVLNNCTILGDFYGAGCQGMVNGTVTSTLTDCTLKHNAFGGGYKAAANEVIVYPITQPTYATYTRETGLFSDFGTVAPETYYWHYRATTGTSGNIIYTTNENMSQLGTVTGDITITLKGNTTVAESVYGGGNESPASSNASVSLQGNTQVTGNVFGGGNKATVTGNTSVKLQN